MPHRAPSRPLRPRTEMVLADGQSASLSPRPVRPRARGRYRAWPTRRRWPHREHARRGRSSGAGRRFAAPTKPTTHPTMSSPKAVDHGDRVCHRPAPESARPTCSAANVAAVNVTTAMTPWVCPVEVRAASGASIGYQLMAARATAKATRRATTDPTPRPPQGLGHANGCTSSGDGQPDGGGTVAGSVPGDAVLAHRVAHRRQTGRGNVEEGKAGHGSNQTEQIQPTGARRPVIHR